MKRRGFMPIEIVVVLVALLLLLGIVSVIIIKTRSGAESEVSSRAWQLRNDICREQSQQPDARKLLDFDRDGLTDFCDVCPNDPQSIDEDKGGLPDNCDAFPTDAKRESCKNGYDEFLEKCECQPGFGWHPTESRCLVLKDIEFNLLKLYETFANALVSGDLANAKATYVEIEKQRSSVTVPDFIIGGKAVLDVLLEKDMPPEQIASKLIPVAFPTFDTNAFMVNIFGSWVKMESSFLAGKAQHGIGKPKEALDLLNLAIIASEKVTAPADAEADRVRKESVSIFTRHMNKIKQVETFLDAGPNVVEVLYAFDGPNIRLFAPAQGDFKVVYKDIGELQDSPLERAVVDKLLESLKKKCGPAFPCRTVMTNVYGKLKGVELPIPLLEQARTSGRETQLARYASILLDFPEYEGIPEVLEDIKLLYLSGELSAEQQATIDAPTGVLWAYLEKRVLAFEDDTFLTLAQLSLAKEAYSAAQEQVEILLRDYPESDRKEEACRLYLFASEQLDLEPSNIYKENCQ